MHADTVDKSSPVQVTQLKCFCQVEGCRRVDWLLGHVQVVSVAHVSEQVVHVAARRGPELAHGVKQRHECASQVSTHHWPSQDPGKEVSERQVVELSLLLGGMRRSRDVQLSRRPRMQLIPPLNVLRRPGREAVQHEELFDERKAAGREQGRKGQLERRPALRVALGIQVDEAVAVPLPYIGVLSPCNSHNG